MHYNGHTMERRAVRAEWAGRVADGKFSLIQWLGGSDRCGVFVTEWEGPPPARASIVVSLADDADARAHANCWTPASALSHPNLMRLLHTGQCTIDGAALLYAVTELAEENLAAVLAVRPLTPREARETLAPILDALACLHAHGLVHGHLHPANITAIDDRLRLSTASLHLAGQPSGHLDAPSAYDAPEAAGGLLMPAADLWSLGATLVEMFTQRPPAWDRATQPAPEVPATVPEPFHRMARGCLQPDPQRRLTVAQIRNLLAPAAPIPAAPVARKSWWRLGAAMAVALVALAVGGVVLLWPGRPSTAPAGSQNLPSQTSPPETGGRWKPSPSTRALPPQPSAPESPPAATERGGTTSRQVPAAAGPVSPERAVAAGGEPRGAVVSRVMPVIPEEAATTIRGSFQSSIRVEVDRQGNVSGAAIDAQGPSHYFAALALDAARQWKFRPPQAGGQSAASVWILRFQFARGATQAAAEQVSP